MAKITVEEQKEFTLLPENSILLLKVDELEIKQVDGRHGPWDKLEIKFKVLGIQNVGDGGNPADYEEAVIAGPIWGSVPFKLTDSPENKLRLWAEAILGMELGVGFELDTDVFLGREVRGLVTQYNKRATNPKTGQPFKGHQIDALLPKAGAPQHQQGYTTQQYAAPVQQQYAAPVADPWAAPQQQAPVGDPWSTPGVTPQQQQYVPPAAQPQYEEPPF